MVPGIKTGEVGRCFQIILKHSQSQAQEKGGVATVQQIMHPADHVVRRALGTCCGGHAPSALCATVCRCVLGLRCNHHGCAQAHGRALNNRYC